MSPPLAGADLAQEFANRTGGQCQGLWQAPGRVNLIGEHTDYNGGFVLPLAIDRRVRVAASLRPDGVISAASLQRRESHQARIGELAAPAPFDTGWAAYVFGVVWSFTQAGMAVPGLEVLVDSDVPSGGGLSSSAALEASVAVALNDLIGASLSPAALVPLCHRAESEYVGVPVGTMDQTAVLCCTAGHALLVDCRSAEIEQVPLDIGPILVVDTRVRHTNSDGSYAARRTECELAARQLGVSSLRNATLEMVEAKLEGVLRKRARHVVTEDDRVLETVRRLSRGDPIGDLLYASHESLRADFEVSSPELDCVVEVAAANGAAGARLTGAGFGGCALVVADRRDAIFAEVKKKFQARGFVEPRSFEVTAAAGASALTV